VTQVTFEGRFRGKTGADTIGRPMLEIPMLDDDETLLAGDATPRRPRMHPSAVTDRRIILTWRTADAGRQREWLHDSVWFHEVTAWRAGHTHDGRPVIVVEHPAHERLEHVPAHSVLWFGWGNAVGPVTHTSTELRYPNRRDPAFLAVLEGLRGTGAPEGEPFEERPPGTRQERMGEGRGVLARRAAYRDRWFRR
jgi:hypothetical protein